MKKLEAIYTACQVKALVPGVYPIVSVKQRKDKTHHVECTDTFGDVYVIKSREQAFQVMFNNTKVISLDLESIEF